MSAGIVIIGAGQAGGWAAKTLRADGYHGKLTVVSDEPYDFYERPPLSKSVLLDDIHKTAGHYHQRLKQVLRCVVLLGRWRVQRH